MEIVADPNEVDRDKIIFGPNGLLWLRLSSSRIPFRNGTAYDPHKDGGAEIDGEWIVEETSEEIDALLREAAEMESERLQSRRIGAWLDRLAKEANR